MQYPSDWELVNFVAKHQPELTTELCSLRGQDSENMANRDKARRDIQYVAEVLTAIIAVSNKEEKNDN